MKTGSIAFPRQFGPGAAGRDVRAVKRALVKWGGTGMADTIYFGVAAQHNLSKFKLEHGLLGDPIYTVEAHEKLKPFFDQFGASLMNQTAAEIFAAQVRAGFIANRRWMVEHRQQIRYAEVRPWPRLPRYTLEFTTDCSGSIELAAYWTPGCPDPSTFGFNGEGNTGSLLAGGREVQARYARPSDLIVYRAGSHDTYGHHVVSIDEKLPGGDFKVVSHGHNGDPGYYNHSAMAASQAHSGYPLATFVRFLA